MTNLYNFIPQSWDFSRALKEAVSLDQDLYSRWTQFSPIVKCGLRLHRCMSLHWIDAMTSYMQPYVSVTIGERERRLPLESGWSCYVSWCPRHKENDSFRTTSVLATFTVWFRILRGTYANICYAIVHFVMIIDFFFFCSIRIGLLWDQVISKSNNSSMKINYRN